MAEYKYTQHFSNFSLLKIVKIHESLEKLNLYEYFYEATHNQQFKFIYFEKGFRDIF